MFTRRQALMGAAAAAMLADGVEASVRSLSTRDEATMLVHYDDGQTRQFNLFRLPEPGLVASYLGAPDDWIACPTGFASAWREG